MERKQVICIKKEKNNHSYKENQDTKEKVKQSNKNIILTLLRKLPFNALHYS